jgi:positive regulator of sigma E activity
MEEKILRFLLKVTSAFLVSLWSCVTLFLTVWTTLNFAAKDWSDVVVGMLLATAWLVLTGGELRDSASVVFPKPKDTP